jgi:hypothetical protein
VVLATRDQAFIPFTQLAAVLQTHRGIVSELDVGRYHCNLELLYLLHTAYHIDVMYVLTSHGDQARPAAVARPAVSAGRPTQDKP